jgi:hypothetical protein
MIYILNLTYEDQFKGYKDEKFPNWYRIRAVNDGTFGIDLLLNNMDETKLNEEVYHSQGAMAELYKDRVSVAFDKKTLNAFVLAAMQFDLDVFLAAFPIGKEGYGKLVNHYIKSGQLYSYKYDEEKKVMLMIFSLRQMPGARITDTFLNVTDEFKNWKGVSVIYTSQGGFVLNERSQIVKNGESVKRDTYMRFKDNVHNMYLEGNPLMLRKYFPGRPTWTVILTKPTLENKVREILAEGYHMTDKRLNLVVADGGKDLKEKCEKLVKRGITAVTYYLAGNTYTSIEVRKSDIRKAISEDLRTNYFANKFKRISVLTPDGVSSHIDIS